VRVIERERFITLDPVLRDLDRNIARISELLGRLEAGPTRTIGMIKRGIHENLGREWRSALDYENGVQVQAYDSAEHDEGVDAFLEGRDPEWD